MTVHIFTAPKQPATRYVDRCGEKSFSVRYNPRHVLPCYGCRRRRYARNLEVQCFYDSTRFWCKGGCTKK